MWSSSLLIHTRYFVFHRAVQFFLFVFHVTVNVDLSERRNNFHYHMLASHHPFRFQSNWVSELSCICKRCRENKKNETQITSQDNPLTPPAFQSACVAPVYCRCRLISTIGSTWAQCALQTPSELSCQRGFPLQRHFWDFGCILVCCMARDNIAYAVSSLTHSLTLLAILTTHPMASLSSFFGSLV